jgi:surface-anchored protein
VREHRPTRPATTLRRPRRRLATLWLAAFALSGLVGAAPAGAQGDPSPLDQVIDRGQRMAMGPAVLERGHVDLGVHFEGSTFTLLVHDDAEVPSVWRRVDDVVLRVRDDARQPTPDDSDYDFIDAEPGSEVHVVPQVEQPGVVWVGWNTQDPDVMAAVDRGVTLSLLDVEGPGQVSVFLQSGALEGPQVLWDSNEEGGQPFWAEVNTHTHANWVFTEPGVYRVQVEASADLLDGTTVSDVRTLRFAVGDGTSVDEALAQVPLVAPVAGDAAIAEPEDESSEGGLGTAAVLGLVGVLVLGAAVATRVVHNARVRRRADELARSSTP